MVFTQKFFFFLIPWKRGKIPLHLKGVEFILLKRLKKIPLVFKKGGPSYLPPNPIYCFQFFTVFFMFFQGQRSKTSLKRNWVLGDGVLNL